MNKKWIITLITTFIILISAIAIGPIMSNVEKPNYEVITSQNNIETRQYKPMIIARVQMNGPRKEAIGDGFRLLADYIFGNNIATKEIAMTAPVEQQNIKIAMTAPVEQQVINDLWQINFVMPSEYTMETLPKPVNKQVKLKKIPAKKFIVIKFSGENSDENVREHEEKLLDHVKDKNISTIGTPKYAFYNPPWTLPPLRRNEVMLEIE